MKAAIIGGGVIGGGWAARFLLNGWDVAVFDPDPEAARKIGEVLDNARRALPALYDRALPAEGTLRLHDSLAPAVADADWVQESVPERLELKHKVHADISRLAPAQAVIGSSTSGFKPSELTAQGARVIVAHPFNPVYLLPLVELVGAADHCARAAGILRGVGMYPLTLRKEIDAHIADRLLEAVWRESLWLVKDGIATTAEIDEAIRMGFGLRWAQMGLFETYRIAGGEAGMAHFMAQFGPALEWPWTKLMDVPEFTPELVELIAGQSDAQSGHMSIRALERLRDDNLVGMMRVLKKTGTGAGGTIGAHETTLDLPSDDGLPVTVHRVIPSGWTDRNGRMNEARYLEIGAQATERFMEMIGCDAAHAAKGGGYVTQEDSLRYLAELHAGETVRVNSQVLLAEDSETRLFHRVFKADGTLAATVDTVLLHVDMATRRGAPPDGPMAARLHEFARAHAQMPWPEGARR
ncbi:carnitine 3-dehydrogenase [Lutimaribacter sp. EGI FJ00014]|uniref:Carnitine 3-dehydrogenase n=1 Tax=Lutimaribacter degradans TaxID=2945989 RepID=A0ACC5ZYY4_9RHOB|nr:carnitine 3-dehydrogenase [Lutimaribacter sp. EGI FJ00013]MCM2562956.1 carnitine 3-dehydrogenase [Lutimaribacter sp. EGI FJ00013]MCO0636101.1 carnitine 3-dehydrogenase [Lutimaribacter sp. EGI FJ00014]